MNIRYFIELSYNGTRYHGWQIQPNAITVQEELNKALSTLLQNEINVVGAGRTDTGVHARFFVAHFEIPQSISDFNKLVFKLNRFLSKDISIHRIYDVPPRFHARFDAVSRTYEYHIHQKKNPFLTDFSYFVTHDLDVEAMNEAAQVLFDYQDFTSFSKLHTDVKTNNCAIQFAKWQQTDKQLIFTISADRFLRNMVRAIVGSLLEVGRHKIDTQQFKAIIESKNRSNAGMSVPPQGLFLTEISYPDLS